MHMLKEMIRTVPKMLGPQRYFALLISVLSLTLLAPLVSHFFWAHIIVSVILIVCMFITMTSLTSNKNIAFGLLILVILCITTWFLVFTSKIPSLSTIPFQIAAYLAALLFFITTGSIMWQDVFSGKPTPNRISGAVCIYLLIGFCFSLTHIITELQNPFAYRYAYAPEHTPIMDVYPSEERYPLFVYFSFCTLSTIGYGDIIPVSRMARSLSWLEGLTGQLYLAILVARLVGQHLVAKATEKS